ncbi:MULTISPECIES: HlyD family efflux transporter periplasmic adaptor subunit [unclassified Sphingobium]|uniref:HlyD family efflux transporter periplasmic adaptor subunit n=1 Tax=unclassified Sphingobium TaxID=2611147 RepID=UPI0022242092|nr:MULTISPECIES: HlyD family efflux transporter periplasmic adaptor subunit [unclassified Sphingobium]MCW2410362.1 HlyD family secretion protein [Sphingobium sp. B8D3D]MCW2413946.1 HlyD family secretion protein [Sphingobium sp. B8D3A]
MTRQRLIVLIIVTVMLIAAVSTRGFGLLGRDDGPLTLYGNVDIREVDLGFRVGGRIAQIPVEEGQRVKQGMLLAELDRASIDSAVAQSDARVAQARAELIKLQRGSRPEDVAQAQARFAAAQAAARDAQRDYERRQPLVAPGAISRDVWESTVAMRDRANAQLAEAQAALTLVRTGARREDIEAARAALQAAEASRKGVGTDLDDARLLASVDGVVVTRAREPGAIVAPGETVFTLAIDRPVRVRAYVAENQLSRIAPGMTVTITADGNPKSYSGIIGYISPRAEFTPKTVETSDLRTDLVYRLRIVVDDPDGKLRQGQPVSVAIADPAPTAKR